MQRSQMKGSEMGINQPVTIALQFVEEQFSFDRRKMRSSQATRSGRISQPLQRVDRFCCPSICWSSASRVRSSVAIALLLEHVKPAALKRANRPVLGIGDDCNCPAAVTEGEPPRTSEHREQKQPDRRDKFVRSPS
jgi:hypothetical protein